MNSYNIYQTIVIKKNEEKWMCWLNSNNNILNEERVKILSFNSNKQQYPLIDSISKLFDMKYLVSMKKNFQVSFRNKKEIDKLKDYFIRK